MNKSDIIKTAFIQIENWLEHHGEAGYDPYDIKGHHFILKTIRLGQKNKFMEILREVIFEFFNMFPIFSRRLFGIQAQINAKAMALLGLADLLLYKKTKQKKYLDKVNYYSDWLLKNPSPGFKNLCWGYPFDWQSDILIKAGTPNGIVTAAAGEFFWQKYLLFHQDEDLSVCNPIATFFEQELSYHRLQPSQLCFHYTPISRNHIHNLNLFVADFLIKAGKISANKVWLDIGQQAVNYTLSNQFENGAFDYSGPPDKPQNFIDHYHTGFVLRALHSIYHELGDEKVKQALEKGYHFYIDNFFINETIPKFRPDRLYRIDIHSCSESIITICTLSDLFPESLPIANKVLIWTIENFQHSSGYFFHAKYKSRIFKFAFMSKIPYIRWAQAWMKLAFAKYFLTFQEAW